jgi:hypothetical protein
VKNNIEKLTQSKAVVQVDEQKTHRIERKDQTEERIKAAQEKRS